jgi:dTDP-4-dehydrorhamnose 3,5-epimerase (EC 5.1.3.13)
LPFSFEGLEVPGVVLIRPKVFGDERGFFAETYKREEFEEAGIRGEFVQDNHSKSEYGVLRGLHFQRDPYSQAKVVRCIRGVIYDVAVDLRKGSDTFGRYIGVILSEYNMHQIYIPRGFAHGFLALSGVVEVFYKQDNVYAPEYEGGLIWNDPGVNISWPIDDPVLAQKDQRWPALKMI